MKVRIGTESVKLGDADLLGAGGEARVYRWRDLAVKIYHPVDPALAGGARQAAEQQLRAKLAKVREFPRGLPQRVIAPLDPVSDDAGAQVGFTMRAVPGAHDLARLSMRSWRQGGVTGGAVAALFGELHDDLEALHSRRVVVGDLNDANVLFTTDSGRLTPWLIDADSMQFGAHLCVVGHERFVDPRLYGVDLTGGPAFSPATDWYSYGVLLFANLLLVHPYGGVHRSHPTLLRRAQARVSVMNRAVSYPRAAIPFKVLPDDLLGWFEDLFEHDRRGAFPRNLLAMRWTTCRCGVEHARPACPDCATKSAGAPALVRSLGRCRALTVMKTTGQVLFATVQGSLRYVVQQDGAVRREDGSTVLAEPATPGMRFALAGSSTWVGLGGRLVRVDRESVKERAVTGTVASTPAFAANSRSVYTLQDEWLVEGSTGCRMGRILEGQTWFEVGERLGIGFYRAGLVTVFFMFHPGRPGLLRLALPSIVGRLVDAAAVFDERHALLLLSTQSGGRETNSMVLLGEDGQVLAQAAGSPHEVRMLASIHGKALLGGRIVCTTDQGLLALKVDRAAREIVEGTLFVETEPFVAQGADLCPGPGGSVYVVTAREIVHVSLD
ncbi:MAG: hypothetical protein HY815_27050 [Candidatus Riflebacteria bacterium]|nr:hypothetical protein [Candidatus Riflebacteria bacterium]